MTYYWVLIAGTTLVASLMFYTLTILIYRLYNAKREAKIRADFLEIITNEICNCTDGQPPPFAVPPAGKFEKEVIQNQLLESIRSLKGIERSYLILRYKKMGFFNFDLDDCLSGNWWKRLSAIVHLGYLDEPSIAPVFHHMMSDKVPIVATAATLALTALDHPLNNSELIDSFPKVIFKRKDVMSEIMTRISKRHSEVLLRKIVDPDADPLLQECCIRAMVRERCEGVVTALTQFLEQSGMDPSKAYLPRTNNIAQVIMGLESIGDPSACASVRRFLKHPQSKIRALAIQMLIQMGDEGSAAEIALMAVDPSIEVQRAIARKAA